MTTAEDIDPPQSGSGLFKATTQPNLDEIKALAIRVLQGPASKTEQVLAAAFLDARRQIERLEAEAKR